MQPNRFTPCDYCGAPGWRVPVLPDFPSVADGFDKPDDRAFATGQACTEHLKLVRNALEQRYAPNRAAARESRYRP